MAIRERDARQVSDEPPVGDLIRQLGQDTATLVRQEIALAKVELKETAVGYARDAGKLGAAAALAWFGAMALLAGLIIAFGALIASYWVSALLFAVLLLAAAAMLARSGVQHLKRSSIVPEETIDTLQEDRRWAQREVRDFKRQLKH